MSLCFAYDKVCNKCGKMNHLLLVLMFLINTKAMALYHLLSLNHRIIRILNPNCCSLPVTVVVSNASQAVWSNVACLQGLQHFSVNLEIVGSSEAAFLLDTVATNNIICESLLPPNTSLKPASLIYWVIPLAVIDVC